MCQGALWKAQSLNGSWAHTSIFRTDEAEVSPNFNQESLQLRELAAMQGPFRSLRRKAQELKHSTRL